jgi:hypothetical protein
MDSITKILKTSAIAVFLFALFMPMVLINHIPKKILVMENKTAAEFPNIFTDEGKLNLSGGWRSDFETYLNDNLGFKEFAVTLYTGIMHKLFNRYFEPHVLLGENNHLFYIPGDISNPLSMPPYNLIPEMELKITTDNISKIDAYCKQHNVYFLFVSVPDKEEVYSEYYPKAFIERPNISRLAQIVKYMNEHSDIDAIDLTDSLVAAKSNEDLLYYKSIDSSHWNMNGAFFGYLAIMNRLRDYQKDLFIMQKNNFSIQEIPVELTTRNGLYLYKGFSDIKYDYQYKKGYSAQLMASYAGNTWQPDPSAELVLQELLTRTDYFSYVHYYRNPSCITGKRFLIFGDSYIESFLVPFFSESFSETLFVLSPDGAIMGEVIEKFKPDFVIYEMVERMYTDNLFEHFANIAP